VAASLSHPLEGRGLFLWLGRKVVERLQERDRDGQELAALLFRMAELAVELVCPIDDHSSSMSCS